jgi:hypothetical protein
MSSRLISPAEAQLLANLLTRPLDVVVYDGWAVYLRSGELALQFYPEEIHTPTAEHPYACISRPAVQHLDGELPSPGQPQWAMRTLDDVTNLALLHTVVSWSPSEKLGSTKLLNVELPAGVAYGPIFTQPRGGPMGRGVFPSDLGVLLETVSGHQCFIYTEAAGYFVYLAITDPAARSVTLMPEWRSPFDLLAFIDTVPLVARLHGLPG